MLQSLRTATIIYLVVSILALSPVLLFGNVFSSADKSHPNYFALINVLMSIALLAQLRRINFRPRDMYLAGLSWCVVVVSSGVFWLLSLISRYSNSWRGQLHDPYVEVLQNNAVGIVYVSVGVVLILSLCMTIYSQDDQS